MRIKPIYESKIPWIFAFTKGNKCSRSIDVAKLKNLIYGKKHLKTGSDTIFFLEHHHVEHQCATNWNRLWRLFVAFTTENWGQTRDTIRWVMRIFISKTFYLVYTGAKTNTLSRNYKEFDALKMCEFCEKEALKTWILWKMRFWNYEFCEK